MFLSFVKLINETIHVGISETTEDRFAHGEGIESYDDFVLFLNVNKFNLSNSVWYDVKIALDNGASMVEYIIS